MNGTLTRAGMLVLVSGLAELGGLGASAPAPMPAPLPTPFPEARYRQMSAKSPFAVASAAAPAAAPTPGFAAQLYVEGVAHIGTKYFVAIKSRDPDSKGVIFLEEGQSTDDGMKVERVQWSDELGKSTVDVSKGAEKATLSFDEQVMAQNATAAAQAAPVALPPGRRLNAAQMREYFNNRPLPGNPAMSAAGPLPTDWHQRVRVIQSGQ